MAQNKRWIVTTSGGQSVSSLANELAKAGFTVDQALDEIGVIVGTGSDDVAKRLRAMPGVSDVSPETTVDIGPPNAPVTW